MTKEMKLIKYLTNQWLNWVILLTNLYCIFKLTLATIAWNEYIERFFNIILFNIREQLTHTIHFKTAHDKLEYWIAPFVRVI